MTSKFDEQAEIRLLHGSTFARQAGRPEPVFIWKLGECAETQAATRLLRLFLNAARASSPDVSPKELAGRGLDAVETILDALLEYRAGHEKLQGRLAGQLRKLKDARPKDWAAVDALQPDAVDTIDGDQHVDAEIDDGHVSGEGGGGDAQPRYVEQVLPAACRIGVEPGNDVVTEARREHEGVVAIAAIHRSVAVAANERVRSGSAVQRVGAGTARDGVGEAVAVAREVACTR
jgi:hypothetical protein